MSSTISLGGLEIDLNRRYADLNGTSVGLTSREFDLLAHLAQNKGTSLSRESVFETVWGYKMEFGSNSLDVYIYRIRRKIEQDPEHPKYLLTMRGYGYKLVGASTA